MCERMLKSLKRINLRLFAALLFMGLCPAVWTTVRTFFLGTMPGEWSYSIAGQLSWVNLIYEVINEAIILPLYFFMVGDKKKLANRIRSGLAVSFCVYTDRVRGECIRDFIQFPAGGAGQYREG